MSAGHRQSGHFSQSLPRAATDHTIRGVIKALSTTNFDTLAFSGYSGACIACPVAHLMNKELLLVRKNEGHDKSNSQMWVEGYIAAKRVVIIDDFVCGGGTLDNLVKGLVTNLGPFDIVAAVMYHSASLYGESYLNKFALHEARMRQSQYGGITIST